MGDKSCLIDSNGNFYCTTDSSDSPSLMDRIDSTLGWLIGHWWLILLALVIIAVIFGNVFIVRQKTAVIIERLGKYQRTLQAGLHAKIPFIDRLVETVDLMIQQIEAKAEIKTSGNEFMTLPVTVLYRVIPERAHDAYYEVDDPEAAIEALIQNEVKSTASGMSLQEIFDSRDRIRLAVEETLTDKLASYGYEVDEVVIDNPIVPKALMTAFNDVTAATQRQRAATADAEALRIKMVGEANAEAESTEIKADAIVNFRNTIAEGNAEAIQKMTEGTNLSHSAILDYFTVVDNNDAVRDAASKGATIVVATGRQTDALFSGVPKP